MWRLLRPDAVKALEDPKVVSSMPRYVGILKGKFLPKFVISRYVPVEWRPENSEEELWTIHNIGLGKMEALMRDLDSGRIHPDELGDPPEKSLLHLKARIGEALMHSCRLCERRCGADRLKGELGFCRVGREFKVHSCFDHLGEEPEVVPSFTVYGCKSPAELVWAATLPASTARTGRSASSSWKVRSTGRGRSHQSSTMLGGGDAGTRIG